MKHELPDADEEARAKTLLEQSFGGVVSFLSITALMVVVLFLALCHACPAAECKLAWNAQPDATKFRIYLGISRIAEVTTNSATVTLPDSPCEIAVKAVSDTGIESLPATLKLAFIRDQESADLKSWATLRGYFREFRAAPRFYRTKIELPP